MTGGQTGPSVGGSDAVPLAGCALPVAPLTTAPLAAGPETRPVAPEVTPVVRPNKFVSQPMPVPCSFPLAPTHVRVWMSNRSIKDRGRGCQTRFRSVGMVSAHCVIPVAISSMNRFQSIL